MSLSGCRKQIALYDIVCTATRNVLTSGKSHVQVGPIGHGYSPPVAAATRGYEASKHRCRR